MKTLLSLLAFLCLCIGVFGQNEVLQRLPPPGDQTVFWAPISGGGGISGLTAGFIPLAGSATTLTSDAPIDYGVTAAGTLTTTVPLTLTNPGVFTTGQSNIFNQTLINGCNPTNEFQTGAPANSYVTTGIGSCVTGVSSPGSYQINAIYGWIVDNNAGHPDSVAVSGACRLNINSGQCFGANFGVNDVGSLTSGEIEVAAELDVGGLNATTAYSTGYGANVVAFNFLHPGTFPWIGFNLSSGNSGVYFLEGLNFGEGALGPASIGINMNTIANASSGANSNSPIFSSVHSAFWTGTASADNNWRQQIILPAGTNPAYDEWREIHTGGPAGALHHFSLDSSNSVDLAFHHTDGSFTTIVDPSADSGGKVLTLPGVSGTFALQGNTFPIKQYAGADWVAQLQACLSANTTGICQVDGTNGFTQSGSTSLTTSGLGQQIQFTQCGTYTVTHPITIATLDSIAGLQPVYGSACVHIKAANSAAISSPLVTLGGAGSLLWILLDGNTGCTACGGTSNAGMTGSTNPVLNITGAGNQTLTSVTVQNGVGAGITESAVSNVYLNNVLSQFNNGQGYLCTNTADVFIYGGSQFEANGLSGVELHGCSSVRVTGADISGNGSLGSDLTTACSLYIHPSSTQPTTANIFTSVQFGNNTNESICDITPASAPQPSYQNTFEGIQVLSGVSGSPEIYVFNGISDTFSGTLFASSAKYGIQFAESSAALAQPSTFRLTFNPSTTLSQAWNDTTVNLNDPTGSVIGDVENFYVTPFLTVSNTGLFTTPTLKITPVAFASLPSCSSGNEGMQRSVTDSTTNTWGATITGSGSDHVLAYCDGSAWTVAAK